MYYWMEIMLSFVPFIGLISPHWSTTIFGCEVISDEMRGSYHWLLKVSKITMCQKKPTSVIMDGDYAMREAI